MTHRQQAALEDISRNRPLQIHLVSEPGLIKNVLRHFDDDLRYWPQKVQLCDKGLKPCPTPSKLLLEWQELIFLRSKYVQKELHT